MAFSRSRASLKWLMSADGPVRAARSGLRSLGVPGNPTWPKVSIVPSITSKPSKQLPSHVRIAAFALTAVLLAPGDSLAQGADPVANSISCSEGKNSFEFTFSDWKSAKLKRVEGGEITLFPDLQEANWTARFAIEDGARSYRIGNARGAVLSVLIPPPPMTKTIGRLTLATPAGGKIDLLCDLSTPMPWHW